jgi:hypothetical protein
VKASEGPGSSGPSSLGAPRTEHGDFHYEIVARTRAGKERVHRYASDEPLEVGAVLRLEGRHWLIESLDGDRATAKPARYRLELRHPDGNKELGAFRRFRPGSPGIGHALATIEDGQPVSWQVTDRRLARDDEGEPYLELVAERDYEELEEVLDHELEHAFAARDEEELPPGAAATFARAEAAGLSLELVALEPGEEPDWDEAERYIDALILDEIEDDLVELCGVVPDRDPRETWLQTVKDRLLEDLRQFRDDVEGDRDEIEGWSFRGGRIFATAGDPDDEANPDSGHGWMSRLVDSSALTAAGFQRVQKARLDVLEP